MIDTIIHGFSTRTGIIVLGIGLLAFVTYFGVVAVQAYRDTHSGNSNSDPARFSYTFVGPLDRLDYAGHKRLQQRVEIPLGRSEEDVRSTLTKAAIHLCVTEDAEACWIYGIRPGDPTNCGWSVGQAVYAPAGLWHAIGEDLPMEVRVELGTLYFETTGNPTHPVAGDGVKCAAGGIDISADRDNWEDDRIIAVCPDGQTVTVVERALLAVHSDREDVRYRISGVIDGETVEGWVHPWDIEPIAGTTNS